MSAETERDMLRRVAALERENSDYMSELNRVWSELDRARDVLMRLIQHPDKQVADAARAGLPT